MKLEKVSDLKRRILAKLGESAAEHQQSIVNLVNQVHTKAIDTRVNVHVLNKKTEAALTYSEPTADIVRKLEATPPAQEEWVPDAYVLFVRHWRCRCGRSGSCLEHPGLFLRHHLGGKRRRTTEQENGPTVLYLPVKGLALVTLPRIEEAVFRALPMCEGCFLCVSASPSSQEPTRSQESKDTKLSDPPSALSSSSDVPAPLKPITSLEELVACASDLSSLNYSQLEPVNAGSIFESLERAREDVALVSAIPTHIIEEPDVPHHQV